MTDHDPVNAMLNRDWRAYEGESIAEGDYAVPTDDDYDQMSFPELDEGEPDEVWG